MRRMLVIAVLLSLGHASTAVAGESLLASATRIAREAARKIPAKATAAGARGQALPAVASSGMKKRTKTLIFLTVAAGFVAGAYAIDHRVKDVTPSTLGTRED